jgi:hypothetical protein
LTQALAHPFKPRRTVAQAFEYGHVCDRADPGGCD